MDVKDWLSRLPEGVLTFWEAFDRIEPIGEEWEATARVCEVVSMPTFAQAGIDPPDWTRYMPPRFKKPKAPKSQQPEPNGFQTLLSLTKLDKIANGKNTNSS